MIREVDCKKIVGSGFEKGVGVTLVKVHTSAQEFVISSSGAKARFRSLTGFASSCPASVRVTTLAVTKPQHAAW